MPEFDASGLRTLSQELFVTTGASISDARLVADHLVNNSLMGLHSHGVMRVPEYLDRIDAFRRGVSPLGGPIDPTAQPLIEAEEFGRAIINGNGGFGQIAGMAAVEVAFRLATDYGVSVVSVHNSGHVGRLGAYPEELAQRGLVALAFCSAPISVHRVAPFGGRDGRMATNPIAYAFPTSGEPVVADFASSAITEGGVRYRRNLGEQLPDGVLADDEGRPTNDPNVLYGSPPGTIQPLGGRLNGHKGFALGLLVDLMATIVAGDNVVDQSRIGNNLTMFGVRPDSHFLSRADAFVDYVRSARPVDPSTPVQMPGDREVQTRQRTATVSVDDITWARMTDMARRMHIRTPAAVVAMAPKAP